MDSRLQKSSLKRSLSRQLLYSVAVGIILILLLYLGGRNLLRRYFIISGYLRQQEIARVEELQDYVSEHALSATDTYELREWAQERGISEFMIMRDDRLYFDISYRNAEELIPGAREWSETTWYDLFQVAFADGEAYVYLYEGAADGFYYTLLVISVFLGFASCLGIFNSAVQEKVRYISELEKEVQVIRAGDLRRRVTVRGEDELASLAEGLDQMRRTLAEKEQTEEELREAQRRLVLGMSHDLRTPLTGLMAYVEILKRQEKEKRVDRQYIDKVYDKILQIKVLSDQMFQYFYIDSRPEIKLSVPETVLSALEDYLSELCIQLESCGFPVEADGIEWPPVLIQISEDYISRIMNNIMSNIEKYGDRGQEVRIVALYDPEKRELSRYGRVGVLFLNGIVTPNRNVGGTGIGVKNISMMMEQMHGCAEVTVSKGEYCIALYFPVVNVGGDR